MDSLYLVFRNEITMIAFERVIRVFTSYVSSECFSTAGLMAALWAAVVVQRVHSLNQTPAPLDQATGLCGAISRLRYSSSRQLFFLQLRRTDTR